MTTDRIKEIQAKTAYPNSRSVQQALLQVWHECQQEEVKNQCMSGFTDTPNELEPVLALISHNGELGLSEWYEVVYYSQKWCSYAGSNTFEDGEKVVKWKYCKDCC